MSYFKETIKAFDDFHKGNTSYFPLVKSPKDFSTSKLGQHINVGKGVYMLLGGNSGSGKTAIVDSEFILKLYIWWKTAKPEFTPYWIYRSMERPTKMKIAKWICYLLYVEHNILMDVPTFFGFPNKRRDLKDYERKLIKGYEHWFTHEFEKHIHIIPGSANPTGIRNYTLNFYRKRGKEFRSTDKEIELNGKKVTDFKESEWDDKKKLKYKVVGGEQIYQFDHKYIPDDPALVVCQITDHINALSGERGFSEKQLIDTHSAYNRTFRDIFDTFIINVSQFNRGQTNTTRMTKMELDVLSSDFMGSSNTYNDADIVIGMINPFKMGITDEYRGYRIDRCVIGVYNRYRALKLLKNSYGADDLRISYAFLGENGFIRELPSADNIGEIHYQKIQSGKLI